MGQSPGGSRATCNGTPTPGILQLSDTDREHHLRGRPTAANRRFPDPGTDPWCTPTDRATIQIRPTDHCLSDRYFAQFAVFPPVRVKPRT